MKLLLTSDLHNELDWYAWLLKAAPDYNLVAISGDLLDGFGDICLEIKNLRKWVSKFSEIGTKLVFCCGNHDLNGENIEFSDYYLENPNARLTDLANPSRKGRWMDSLQMPDRVISSGQTVFLTVQNQGQIIVTTCWFTDDEDCNATFLKRGLELKAQYPEAPWLVLHHEPPSGPLSAGIGGSATADSIIRSYAPDYMLCGHDHLGPFFTHQCFDLIGKTYVFNPGHRRMANVPSYIELDTATKLFQWHHQ